MSCNQHEWDNRRILVTALYEACKQQDESAFSTHLNQLNSGHNSLLITGVRQVASNLQAALEKFHHSSHLLTLAEQDVPNARLRLAHVLKLTDEAANHTMDLVDQCRPLLDTLIHDAKTRLSMNSDSTLRDRTAHDDVANFLDKVVNHTQSVRSNLTEVLVTQGYQDISGQIICSVIKLVDELELSLTQLVEMSHLQRHESFYDSSSNFRGQGPVIPGLTQGPIVNSQQDVDTLLTAIGIP